MRLGAVDIRSIHGTPDSPPILNPVTSLRLNNLSLPTLTTLSRNPFVSCVPTGAAVRERLPKWGRGRKTGATHESPDP